MSDLNYIKIGPGGTFRKLGNFQSTPEDVIAILDEIKQKNRNHIAFYIHGGLVDEGAGIDGAKRFRDVFAEADAHGLSLVWETGWWETIRKNLTDIFSTQLFQKIVEKVLARVVAKFTKTGGKGPGDGKIVAQEVVNDQARDKSLADETRDRVKEFSADGLDEWREQMEGELQYDIAADDEFRELFDDPAERTPIFDDPTQEVNADPNAPKSKALKDWIPVSLRIAAIAWHVGTRFWRGRDHGLHATAVEEVFREFYLADLFKTLEWDGMKKGAQDMWRSNAGLTGLNQHAGTFLLEQLIELKKQRPELTIDLVAHSAGAIVVCELFAALRDRYPGALPIRNIIFLAPASTSVLFYTNVLCGDPQFDDFYMFTMPDELERIDAVLRPVNTALQFVYPSSLLYIVSGILEEELDLPLLGMVRFNTGIPPFESQKLRKVRDFLMTVGKQRLTLSTGGEGAAPANTLFSQATSHGAFSSDAATMRSIQWILKHSNAAPKSKPGHASTPTALAGNPN